jgi:hypothetical protein
MNYLRWTSLFFLTVIITGCVSAPPKDYSAFRAAQPKSILILPPDNKSPDVKATYAMLAQMTRPIAEAGYYVIPVTLMETAFKENGVHIAAEAQSISPNKLQEIFGADAALYTEITEYGSQYKLIASEAVVAARARLVDLRTGTVLWTGEARASSSENQSAHNQGGLAGLLIGAIVDQVINNIVDNSYQYAGIASYRLLSAGGNGIIYGHRSPYFHQDNIQR